MHTNTTLFQVVPPRNTFHLSLFQQIPVFIVPMIHNHTPSWHGTETTALASVSTTGTESSVWM